MGNSARLSYSVDYEFSCHLELEGKVNQILDTFCHSLYHGRRKGKCQDCNCITCKPGKCECVNCLRTYWITNKFRYTGKVYHYRDEKHNYIHNGPRSRLSPTAVYSYYATGEGKCRWLNGCEFTGTFKNGAPVFGTLKYNDGAIYTGGFSSIENKSVECTTSGTESTIQWPVSNGSVIKFTGVIPKTVNLYTTKLKCYGVISWPDKKNAKLIRIESEIKNALKNILPPQIADIIVNYSSIVEVEIKFSSDGKSPIICIQ